FIIIRSAAPALHRPKHLEKNVWRSLLLAKLRGPRRASGEGEDNENRVLADSVVEIRRCSHLQHLPSQTRRKSTVGRAFAGGISTDAMHRKNLASPFETVTTVLLRHASFDRWPISSVASAAPGGIITLLCTTPDSMISPTFLWNILFDSSVMKRF